MHKSYIFNYQNNTNPQHVIPNNMRPQSYQPIASQSNPLQSYKVHVSPPKQIQNQYIPQSSPKNGNIPIHYPPSSSKPIQNQYIAQASPKNNNISIQYPTHDIPSSSFNPPTNKLNSSPISLSRTPINLIKKDQYPTPALDKSSNINTNEPIYSVDEFPNGGRYEGYKINGKR